MTEPPSYQYETKPNPDPTIATNEAVERAMKSERDFVIGQIAAVEIRLDGMDEATKLRLEQVPSMRDEIVTRVSHLADLTQERILDIEKQLAAAEKVRIEQKTDSITGLNAALLAAKDAAAETNRSNTLAISKSEQATAETIKTNQELTKSTTDSLTKSLDELKLQVSRIEATKIGQVEQLTEHRQSNAALYGVVGAAVAVLGIVILLANILTSTP